MRLRSFDAATEKRETVHLKHARLVVYFTIAALIFAAFIYLGTTGGFSDALDIGLVVVLWLFVIAATKTGLVKVPPGWRLRPFANTTVQFKRKHLLRALACVVLAMAWTAASARLTHIYRLDDSMYGVALVFVPMVVFLGLFVTFIAKGTEIKTRQR
jgi:hypothetical protein